MATIAIGDIHGNRRALNDTLDQIRGEVADDDTVVFLGDYIDRGPDTKGCIDAVLAFQRDVRAKVVCLLGNHEDWLLRTFRDHACHSWLLGMEAFATIRSYSVDAERLLRKAKSNARSELWAGHCTLPYEAFFDAVPREHIQFLDGLRVHHRTADCVCSHGGLDPRVSDLDQQTRYSLIWGAGPFPDDYEGADTVVYGHRNNAVLTAGGWPTPALVGRTFGIDTISHGVLTALRLPDARIFQTARYDLSASDA